MESLAVTVGDRSIYDFTTLPVNQALQFLDGLTLTNTQMMIADRILKEIRERLRFLRSVGPVSYTHLDVYKRQLPALSTFFPPVDRKIQVRFAGPNV